MDYNSSKNSDDENSILAYDLRQAYAKIVGEHFEDIAIARKADNYPVWFKALKDLYVVTHHKFSDSAEEIKKYKDFLAKITNIANTHPEVWLGKVKIPAYNEEVEDALRDLEMFLYELSYEANIFGGRYEDDGL